MFTKPVKPHTQSKDPKQGTACLHFPKAWDKKFLFGQSRQKVFLKKCSVLLFLCRLNFDFVSADKMLQVGSAKSVNRSAGQSCVRSIKIHFLNRVFPTLSFLLNFFF